MASRPFYRPVPIDGNPDGTVGHADAHRSALSLRRWWRKPEAMATLGRIEKRADANAPAHEGRPASASKSLRALERPLLLCAVLAAVVTAANDLIAGSLRPGYNFASQSISVLSAPGAPSRPIALGFDLVVDVLVIAFAVGLWLTADEKRSLRAIAGLLVTSALLQSSAVVFFPFRPGEPTSSLANTLNVAMMAPSIVGWFLSIALGGLAFRNWFRWFSLSILVALFVEDFLATAGAYLFVAGGHPGSLVGIQERANVYSFYAWLGALALAQLKAALNHRWH